MIDSIDREAQYMEDLKTATPDSSLNDNSRKTVVKDIEKVFIPNAHNKPPAVKPILTINGNSILTHQNVTAIIASPGSGKSSICEAVCSSAINRDCDSLGIKVSSDVKKVLFIDTERVNSDVWNSYDRMNRRAGTKDSSKAKIIGLRMIPRLEERRKVIIELIEKFKPQLIILDGAGDMVTDTNSLEQAIETRIWFRELTVKYKLSILTTLHPNKNSSSPRGHIGSELLRESEGVFIIDNQGEVKTFTDDFEHGKNRNNEKISTSFSWCNSKNMFMSCDAPVDATKKTDAHLELSNEQIISLVKELTKKELNATDFKDLLKITIKERYKNVRVGSTAMTDFYTWLQVKKYILVEGSRAKKVVKSHPSLEPKKEGKQSELPMK